ncbi:hypothetical protein MLD38_023158 [Melastoma candidum]|uniref:Uncharacterized protein n=1 Tax=Melastoma candidum TaxID=119954 RepID=A0ACB9QMT7_9MYRT|nr:hypothetical protein MLD38_023158 [Melastoma candidum]
MTNAAVDTSRPFSSVKEAVAMFGDRIPFKEVRNSPPQDDSPPSFGTPSPWKSPREVEEQVGIEHVLKKLEAELMEAKEELKLLKKKETETEVAVAALNAELHRSMSRLAKAEADAASRRLTGLEKGKEQHAVNERRTEITPYSPTLAQILIDGENQEREAHDGDAAKRMKTTTVTKKKQQQKQKPIVPLVWELFSRRKTSTDVIHKSIYYSSPHLFN